MTTADLVGFLKDVNPVAPACLEYCGFVFDADSAEVFNGRVYIQGY